MVAAAVARTFQVDQGFGIIAARDP